jgi:hypothetical protein
MTKPPITADQIPPEWPVAVRDALNNCKGSQVRAGFDYTIEAWSALRCCWMILQLPGGGTHFTTEADRDLVLGAIMGLNVMPAAT